MLDIFKIFVNKAIQKIPISILSEKVSMIILHQEVSLFATSTAYFHVARTLKIPIKLHSKVQLGFKKFC